MRTIDRVLALSAAVCFVATLVTAWMVTMDDAFGLWYLPLLLAIASGLLTIGALQHRKRKRNDE